MTKNERQTIIRHIHNEEAMYHFVTPGVWLYTEADKEAHRIRLQALEALAFAIKIKID